MRSIIQAMLELTEVGYSVSIFDEAGNGLIGDARAVMVAQFLAGDGTDLIFVDWDVVWEKGTILRMVEQPVDFVAAIYPQRKDPIEFTVSYILDRPELRADPATGLLEVEGVPFGCVRLTRNMLERMVAQYSDTVFYCKPAPKQTAWALFDPYRIGNLKFGEDMAFCRRWRAMGGKVWIDPNVNMGHIGFKTFIGNIGQHLRSRPRKVELGMDAVEKLMADGGFEVADREGLAAMLAEIEADHQAKLERKPDATADQATLKA